jgi:pyruvate kinase
MRDLDFVFEHGFHFVALSFVRSARDLAPLKDAVGKSGAFLKIIAKIEKPEAAERIEEILDCCDGIMVARGDLGVEASLWTVPILQKDLIRRARTKGRVVIVATQMLESMIEHPVPTRAETTDVANAILDGADAVMLSGETAVGRYPVETVETMARILKVTEASSYFSRELAGIETPSLMPPHAVCEAAATASRDLGDIPIVVFTLSGDTAWYMANIRPQAPLIAFSSSRRVVAQLALAWNTIAFELPFEGNVVRLIKMAETKLLETGCLAFHDSVVIVCGTTSVHGATNFMQIRQLGEQ